MFSSVATSAFFPAADADSEQNTDPIGVCEVNDAEAIPNETAGETSEESQKDEEQRAAAPESVVINESDYSPGYHLVEGYIVFIKQDGSAARNETVGIMDFRENGIYTTGDTELDERLAQLFIDSSAADYEFGSLEQLKAMFNWVVDKFGYRKGIMIEEGTHGWENDCAKTMLDAGKGNCYMHAALFYQISKALGYEPVAYSGKISKDKPHGWVEIEFDGKPYIFDTELCYQQYTYQHNYNCNFFKRSYTALHSWGYAKAGADIVAEADDDIGD